MIKLAKLNNKPEIFHSVQGEGKNMGKPSIFIRLSLCNLYCIWCDTDYTWNWKGTSYKHNHDAIEGYKKYEKENLIDRLSNEEILNIVTKINCNNLVITGGEPLVQQKELVKLITELKDFNPNYHIEFETNGTLKPSVQLDQLTDQYNVSIKLSNSNVLQKDRINPISIDFFSKSPKSNFKFVIDNQQELNEILSLIKEFQIKNDSIYLMPQGTSVATLKQKQEWIVEICKEYNFNYTDRLHIHIWGDKRGV